MYSYRIEQAIRAAAVLHRNQVRKGSAGIPYVSHLFAVMLVLSDYTDDEDVLVASLLHDTLEDTDYTPEELEEDFGRSVRQLIESLSEPQSNSDQPLTWQERKQAYTKLLSQAPHGALLIAAADKIHNLRGVVEQYHGYPQKFLTDFEAPLKDRLFMYQEIANILNKNLKSGILGEFNHVFDEYKKFIKEVDDFTNTDNL